MPPAVSASVNRASKQRGALVESANDSHGLCVMCRQSVRRQACQYSAKQCWQAFIIRLERG